MVAHPPNALSLATPLERRTRRDSPSASPTRDRWRIMGGYDAVWAVSPSITLKAFTDGIDPSADIDEHTLLSGISTASAAEKDLGARVASATKKLKAWCTELERWRWSETFDQPQDTTARVQEKGAGRPNGDGPTTNPTESKGGYWGSLPTAQVQAYGERLDQIKEELEDLNMDELKGYILDMYPIERPPPGSGLGSKRAQLHLLDDFSYVVTHTMLQALPCLSYLNQLTRVWSVRLAVLREVPQFLVGLDGGKTAMRLGWDALDLPEDPQNSAKALDDWKEAIKTIRGVLQGKITRLGQRLDAMLDALEGMNDVLPDRWIDDFEGLEANYSKWAADAQRRIFEIDMLMSRPPEKLTRPTSARGADRPFGFGSIHGSRNGLLSPTNGQHRLLSEDNNDGSSKGGESLARPEPGIRRTITTFGPTLAGGQFDRGHQRTRSRSEPHVHLSPFKLSPSERLETIEGTPTKAAARRAFIVDPEQTDRDASEQLSEEEEEEEEDQEEAQTPDISAVRRASVASIESFERSDVKSIDIRRSSSLSSAPSLPLPSTEETIEAENPQTTDSSPPSFFQAGSTLARTDEEAISSSQSSDGEVDAADTPDLRREEYYTSPSPSLRSSPAASFDDSPSLRPIAERPSGRKPRPSLNSAMPKRRGKAWKTPAITQSDVEMDDDSKVFDRVDSPEPNTRHLHLKRNNQTRRISSATEDLEKQIRRIITSVHAPIRLTSGQDADSPVEHPSKRSFSGSRPPSSLRVARKPSTPSMTLSPVKYEHDHLGDARRHVRHGDSDIKLYHLMQPGNDKPIKLFVRRVGENGERVMVRVGGGWADLGEYLRQYAEHHSRRVVSEGKVEALQTPDSTVSRPTSSHSTVGSKPAAGRFLGTPGTGPSNNGTPATRSRPASAMSAYSSAGRDDRSDFGASGASQKSWAGSEVGLAGPNTKKLELTEEKLEWIEGMMNQAKMLSAKSVGTKKVFLKNQQSEQGKKAAH